MRSHIEIVLSVLIVTLKMSCAFVADSQADLTIDLLTQLSGNRGGSDKNVLVSPSSIFYGLAMLYRGMDGQTKRDVGRALGLPSSDRQFEDAMKNFTTKKEDSPLFTGNVISLKDCRGCGAATEYSTDIKNVFHADIYKQNFTEPEKQRYNINKWVAKRTNQKIKNLMPPGSINRRTTIVLVNALYFKSEWETAFDFDDIKGTFQTSSGQSVETENLFKRDIDVRVDEKAPGDATVVGVPFSKGDGFYMVLVLPKEGQSPSELLDSRSADALMSVVARPDDLSREVVELTLPKFNVTMGNELTDLLSSIPGLSSAFVRGADYSRMTDKPVEVSSVNHKATLEVNKDGAEASAATSISIIPYSLFEADKKITFDRPFAFFIVEHGKAIHMAGILNNPSK